MTKRSRLAEEKCPVQVSVGKNKMAAKKPVFSIEKPEKNVREMTIQNPDSPAFGCSLYLTLRHKVDIQNSD